MKNDELYSALKDLALKLNIEVSEQNFRNTGVPVKSGICKVRGQVRILINKNKKLSDKLSFLAETLAEFPMNDLYLLPAVREYLEKCKPLKVGKSEDLQ